MTYQYPSTEKRMNAFAIFRPFFIHAIVRAIDFDNTTEINNDIRMRSLTGFYLVSCEVLEQSLHMHFVRMCTCEINLIENKQKFK